MKYKVTAVYRGFSEAYRISHVSNGIAVKPSTMGKYMDDWHSFFYDSDVAQRTCDKMNKDWETNQFNKKFKEYL